VTQGFEGLFQTLTSAMETAPGATEDKLQQLQASLPRSLPDDYLAFLRWSDGAEGVIGPNYIQLWAVETVSAMVHAHEEFVPGLLFIASDGGAGLFAYDLRQATMPIVITHTDDLDLATLVPLAPSFGSFLEFLVRQDWSAYWGKQYRKPPSSR
jgi:cell wall assembly regulator SMI1